ncbi:MAG: nitroreductase [Thermoleophilia bacterium]|nr:nitroreductase [Thermoleophilia bacterium]
MNVADAIRGRRSVGRVRQDGISRERILRMVEAATWAPNHKVTEPWRFVVIAGDARDALGEAHADAVARANGSPLSPEARSGAVALTRRAPVIIVCICTPSSDDPVVRREDRDAVSAAVQNLGLAAHADGLGTIWRTGLFVDEDEVRAHLGCAPADEIVGFVYVGEPEEAPAAPPRRPAEEVTEWRGWD